MLHTVGYPLDIAPAPCVLPDIPVLVAWHPRDTHDARLRWLRGQIEACVATASARR